MFEGLELTGFVLNLVLFTHLIERRRVHWAAHELTRIKYEKQSLLDTDLGKGEQQEYKEYIRLDLLDGIGL